jgi:hypothetical protein
MDYDAWQQPYNPQLKHFRPLFPTRSESIAYAQAKHIERFSKQDPSVFMIKVADDETQEIIGWAVWKVNDPATLSGGRTVAHWYPEGSEEREFAEIFINGLWGFIEQRVTRKHMGTSFPP